MDTSRNKVVLKMLPRVDYTRKRGVLRGSDDENRKRRRTKPPAKLFDPEAIKLVSYFITCSYSSSSMKDWSVHVYNYKA